MPPLTAPVTSGAGPVESALVPTLITVVLEPLTLGASFFDELLSLLPQALSTVLEAATTPVAMMKFLREKDMVDLPKDSSGTDKYQPGDVEPDRKRLLSAWTSGRVRHAPSRRAG